MNQSSTYILCARLVTLGLTTGLADKLDVFFALGRLTSEEYTDLMVQVGGEESGK